MTAVNGPKVVSDGLVFAFDMSNTEKSWKGKPTINLTTDSPTQSGWMGSYTVVDSSTKTFTITTQQNSSATTSAWRTWYWSVAGYAGSTLTISLDVEYVSNVIASFLHFTVGQGNTGQYPTHIAGSNAEDRVQITTKPTEKTHMTWTGVINATEIMGVTLWINNVIADGDNVTLKISNVQIEVNDFETPFVNGTRGSNSSILDLTLKGTVTNNSLTYNSDGTFLFDGNDYLDLGYKPYLLTDSKTNEAWVYGTSFTNWHGIVSNMSTWGTGFSLQIGVTQNIAAMIQGNYLKTSWTPSTNTWYHIVATRDGNTNENILYVNGVREASATIDVTYQENAVTRIGCFYTTPSLHFTGSIPEIRIYDRALTADEVLNNYEATKNKYI